MKYRLVFYEYFTPLYWFISLFLQKGSVAGAGAGGCGGWGWGLGLGGGGDWVSAGYLCVYKDAAS